MGGALSKNEWYCLLLPCALLCIFGRDRLSPNGTTQGNAFPVLSGVEHRSPSTGSVIDDALAKSVLPESPRRGTQRAGVLIAYRQIPLLFRHVLTPS